MYRRKFNFSSILIGLGVYLCDHKNKRTFVFFSILWSFTICFDKIFTVTKKKYYDAPNINKSPQLETVFQTANNRIPKIGLIRSIARPMYRQSRGRYSSPQSNHKFSECLRISFSY